MNERIKELLEQAGVKYVTMPKDTVYEKFAELIVQECIEIIEPCKCGCRCEQEVVITDSIIADIKEHFGVEE